jgi:DNA helicase-2/ATP-dependent DNA helicase PcrA
MDSFLNLLNPHQREAVCHNGEGLLVLAGAGTGKTRVLTSRIAWLLSEGHCQSRDIMAVTFTNKAAKEMRERLEVMVAFGFSGLTLGTFHGICHRLLRRHAVAAGVDKNFQIMDSSDQLTFIRRLLREKQVDEKEFPPTECRSYINAAKENGVRAAAAPVPHKRAAAMRELYSWYEESCRREHKADFAELLLAVVELLRKDADLRTHYARRFLHILVDEFQDTNALQYEWLKLLDSGDNHFFAVGDDDQSIYAFRGADPGNMLRFQEELRSNTIVRLEQNYRSTGNILHAANRLIATNHNRIGKNLKTDQGGGAPINIIRATKDIEEAANIVIATKQLLETNMVADEVAVLYRTNAQSRLLEQAMIEYAIPYRIYGGTRFYERLEVKHALAYLRLIAGDDRDALIRVINMPPRGIGTRAIEKLQETATQMGSNLFAALEAVQIPKIGQFAALLRKIRALYASGADLPTLARAAIEQSGLLEHYSAKTEDTERAENLREFVNGAVLFQTSETDNEDNSPLLQFIANAVLESGEAQGAPSNAVNLMTIHAAKGLEFMHVFVAGLEEGLFPTSQSLNSINTAAIEEERRLMYVALTRARRELSLHYAGSRQVYGETKYLPPSRFLNELPADCLSTDAVDTLATPVPSITSVPQPSFQRTRLPRPPMPTDEDNIPDMRYRAGDTVLHPRYGKGVVIRRQGNGDDLQVQVTFKKLGIKTFKAALAPLKKISG